MKIDYAKLEQSNQTLQEKYQKTKKKAKEQKELLKSFKSQDRKHEFLSKTLTYIDSSISDTSATFNELQQLEQTLRS